jgi:hypothetical protein
VQLQAKCGTYAIFEQSIMATANTAPRWQKIVAIISIASLLALVIYRAIVLQITNDEAYSFLLTDTCLQSFSSRKLMVGTANTHWLNSLAMFIQAKLLGNSVLVLRLHSIISFALFSAAIFKISELLKNFFPCFILCFAFLLCNAYLLDFFSLCRGYALAIALQAWAIFYIIKDYQKYPIRISVLLSLSIWANFSFILLPIALLIVHFAQAIKFGLGNIVTQIKMWHLLILNIILAIPVLFYIKYVGHDLEEGQANGLIADTFSVFIARSYNLPENSGLAQIIAVISLAIIASRAIFFYRKASKGLQILWLALFSNLILLLVLFYALHSPYPYGRTAFSVVIPALILVCEALLFFISKLSKFTQYLSATAIAASALFHFISIKNINATNEWWMQQGLKECFAKLYQLEGDNIKNIKLGMSIDHYGSFMNYYKHLQPTIHAVNVFNYYRNPYSTMPPETDSALVQQDYLMMIGDYKPYLDKIIPPSKRIVIARYGNMKTDLLKIIK